MAVLQVRDAPPCEVTRGLRRLWRVGVGRGVEETGLREGLLALGAFTAPTAVVVTDGRDAGEGQVQWEMTTSPDDLIFREPPIGGQDRDRMSQALAHRLRHESEK